jgi:hypothetical protein
LLPHSQIQIKLVYSIIKNSGRITTIENIIFAGAGRPRTEPLSGGFSHSGSLMEKTISIPVNPQNHSPGIYAWAMKEARRML